MGKSFQIIFSKSLELSQNTKQGVSAVSRNALFFRKCSYACCACSSSNNHIDSMEEIDRLFKRLYENNISGKINDSRFEKLSVDYENEQAELPKSIIAEMLTHASKSRTA